MPKWDHKGTDRLRKGRLSIPGARYFVTMVTESRRAGLHQKPIAELLIEATRDSHRDGDWNLHCGTIMPDHVHLLFTLGQVLTLGQAIGKWKSRAKLPLGRDHLCWQENFHDHRLRADASLESFARYTFLNPYRRKLLPINQQWTWWMLNKNYRPEFLTTLENGQYPPPQWLLADESIQSLIERDEAANRPPSKA